MLRHWHFPAHHRMNRVWTARKTPSYAHILNSASARA